MEQPKSKRKVKLNPHIEPHGHHAIEWSYHFPLQPGYRIDSSLSIAFASEKVPGSARGSLTQANLTTTRLSLADTAVEVRSQSLRFLSDSVWVCEKFVKSLSSSGQMTQNHLETVPKFIQHRAKDYWSASFFPRMGLFLQSDLKHCSKKMHNAVASFDSKPGIDWAQFAVYKKNLLSAFRAASRFVTIAVKLSALARQTADTGEVEIDKLDLGTDEQWKRFQKESLELAELATVLVCKIIAELQASFTDAIRKCEEARLLMHQGDLPARHQPRQQFSAPHRDTLDATLSRLHQERTWLSQWARLSMEWRDACHLPSLAEIAVNPTAAAQYFERVLELKRHHYQVWDLLVDLRPNESRIDFWIGAVAAGVAAAFASLATLLMTFSGGLSVQQTSLIAIVLFILANVVIYVLKDRMKELLKIKVKSIFRDKSGWWVGACYLQNAHTPYSLEHEEARMAEVQRQSWWTKEKDKWRFQISEQFRILPEASLAKAGIVKQTWRLPLDEILDTLDDTHHVLKLPTLDGIPQEVPVLKRVVFPFEVSIFVRSWKNRQLVITDHAKVQGRIVASGAKIVAVE